MKFEYYFKNMSLLCLISIIMLLLWFLEGNIYYAILLLSFIVFFLIIHMLKEQPILFKMSVVLFTIFIFEVFVFCFMMQLIILMVYYIYWFSGLLLLLLFASALMYVLITYRMEWVKSLSGLSFLLNIFLLWHWVLLLFFMFAPWTVLYNMMSKNDAPYVILLIVNIVFGVWMGLAGLFALDVGTSKKLRYNGLPPTAIIISFALVSIVGFFYAYSFIAICTTRRPDILIPILIFVIIPLTALAAWYRLTYCSSEKTGKHKRKETETSIHISNLKIIEVPSKPKNLRDYDTDESCPRCSYEFTNYATIEPKQKTIEVICPHCRHIYKRRITKKSFKK